MDIWGGMFLFLVLVLMLAIEVTLGIYIVNLIHNGSSWEVFSLSIGLLILLGAILFTVWIGGDQMMLGYHMYG